MARTAGKAAVVKVEDSASTVRDISNRVTSVTLTPTADALDITGLNMNWREQLGGLQTFGIDLRGIYDNAGASALGVDELFFSQLGHVIACCVLFAGSPGDYYAGSALVTTDPTTAEVGAVVTWGVTLAGTGLLTRSA